MKTVSNENCVCKYCGSREFIIYLQTFENGEQHLGRDCAKCGCFVQYVPKLPENYACVDKDYVIPNKKERHRRRMRAIHGNDKVFS